MDVVRRVQGKAVVDAGRLRQAAHPGLAAGRRGVSTASIGPRRAPGRVAYQDDQVARADLDADPAVVLVADVKVAAAIQDAADLFVLVDVPAPAVPTPRHAPTRWPRVIPQPLLWRVRWTCCAVLVKEDLDLLLVVGQLVARDGQLVAVLVVALLGDLVDVGDAVLLGQLKVEDADAAELGQVDRLVRLPLAGGRCVRDRARGTTRPSAGGAAAVASWPRRSRYLVREPLVDDVVGHVPRLHHFLGGACCAHRALYLASFSAVQGSREHRTVS